MYNTGNCLSYRLLVYPSDAFERAGLIRVMIQLQPRFYEPNRVRYRAGDET